MSNRTIGQAVKDRPRRLISKVAVVTGASKGGGAEIARRLAAEGASVVANYSSSREGANKVVPDIVAAGAVPLLRDRLREDQDVQAGASDPINPHANHQSV